MSRAPSKFHETTSVSHAVRARRLRRRRRIEVHDHRRPNAHDARTRGNLRARVHALTRAVDEVIGGERRV